MPWQYPATKWRRWAAVSFTSKYSGQGVSSPLSLSCWGWGSLSCSQSPALSLPSLTRVVSGEMLSDKLSPGACVPERVIESGRELVRPSHSLGLARSSGHGQAGVACAFLPRAELDDKPSGSTYACLVLCPEEAQTA